MFCFTAFLWGECARWKNHRFKSQRDLGLWLWLSVCQEGALAGAPSSPLWARFSWLLRKADVSTKWNNAHDMFCMVPVHSKWSRVETMIVTRMIMFSFLLFQPDYNLFEPMNYFIHLFIIIYLFLHRLEPLIASSIMCSKVYSSARHPKRLKSWKCSVFYCLS